MTDRTIKKLLKDLKEAREIVSKKGIEMNDVDLYRAKHLIDDVTDVLEIYLDDEGEV